MGLFIAVDDLNDWVGSIRGHPQAMPPNVGPLATTGVRSTNANTVGPARNPTRATALGVRLATVTGVGTNQGGQSPDRTCPGCLLLPTAFNDRGYWVWGAGRLLHCKGKQLLDNYFTFDRRWNLISPEPIEHRTAEPPSKGTENLRHETADSLVRTIILPLNRMPCDRRTDRTADRLFGWGAFGVPDTHIGDTAITDWAIERINSSQDSPFFRRVGYYRPHIPLWAPKCPLARIEESPGKLTPVKQDALTDLSATAKRWEPEPVAAGRHTAVFEHGRWRATVDAYRASVTYVDYEIGQLLGSWDSSAAADYTAAVLWSEHGWHIGQKEYWDEWTGWGQSTRVPLIVGPTRIDMTGYAIGGRSIDLARLIDAFLTLVALSGISSPSQFDGQSLVPLMRRFDLRTGRAVVTLVNPNNVSLRTDQWRCIRYAGGAEDLYDRRSDPNEWVNFAPSADLVDPVHDLRNLAMPHLEEDASRNQAAESIRMWENYRQFA